jgi:TolB protein
MLRKLQILLVAAAAASFAVAFGTSSAQAAFPGQNGKIVVVGIDDGDYDLYQIDADGTAEKLTHNKAADVEPAYSAKGELAYVSTVGAGGDLDIYRRQGIVSFALTDDPAQDTDPTWSPDGERIAFASNRDGDFEIYVMDRKGENLLRITDNTTDDIQPAWSPDGKKIAYVHNDGDDEVYFQRYDHLKLPPGKLTQNTVSDRRPSYSPDGEHIVFTSDRNGNYDVFRMTKAGLDQVPLTDHAAFDSQPVYSPDGAYILFVSERLGPPRVHIMNASGLGEKLYAGGLASSETPDWASKQKQHISDVQVNVRGTYATVSFKQSIPTTKARIELWRPKKEEGASVRLQTKNADTEQTAWSITVTHLDPGTSYELHVIAPNPTGGAGDEYVRSAVVKTLKRNVRVKFVKIHVLDDSDPNDCGELAFDFLVGDQFGRVGDDDLCDHESIDVDVTLELANVKDDTVDFKVLGVDDDECECGFGAKFTTFTYGSLKDDGEWTQGKGSLPVGVKSFTSQGENYPRFLQITVDGPSGNPRFWVKLVLTVRHV